MITYAPFWKMMERKGISGYALIKNYGLCKSEVSRLKKDHNFNIYFIDHLCNIFECEVEDIVKHI